MEGIDLPGREPLQVRPRAPGWAALIAQIEQTCADDASPAGESADRMDMLRRLLDELDVDRRAMVAGRLADRPCLPRDVAMALAGDLIVVARPVLLRSPALSDDDLIELVYDCSREHHIAIAERKTVSADVSDILIEMGDLDVMVRLLENPGAEFYDQTLSRLVSASRHYPELREPLLRRSELSPEWASAMSGWVGEALQDKIARRFGRDAVVAPEGAGPDRPVGHDHPCGPLRIGDMPARRASEHVHTIIEAVRCGDMRRVEQAFAALTGLPGFAVTRILYNTNPEPLAIVCRALSIKRRLFAALYTRLHCTQGFSGIDPARQLRTAVGCFNRLQGPQASGILETWRRAPITVWHNPGWKTRAAWAEPSTL
jgi:hypothetical protein